LFAGEQTAARRPFRQRAVRGKGVVNSRTLSPSLPHAAWFGDEPFRSACSSRTLSPSLLQEGTAEAFSEP